MPKSTKQEENDKALLDAARNGSVEEVRRSLLVGVDVNAALKNGVTALILAADKGHAEVVNALLDAKANVNAASKTGFTPLGVAVRNGHSDDHLAVVKALLNAKANVNVALKSGVTPLYAAALNGHLNVVKALVQAGADLEAKNNNGWQKEYTPLHWAALRGNAAIVNVLVQAGADLEAKNYGGNTALHMAARNGHLDVVNALLDEGANVNAASKTGFTPLGVAARNGHSDDHLAVVKALVQAGADLEAKNNVYGCTPLHLAACNDHAAVVNLITAYVSRGENKWRKHLPYLRKAAREYNHPTRQSSAEGAAPEPQLVKKKPASIESVANRVIPVFLHLISLPQKKLALAKLLKDRLSEKSPVINPCMDFFRTIGEKFDDQPKRIHPAIEENFAKIMAALDALEKYKGSRPDVAREIIGKIIEFTQFGKIFSSEGAFVGIDEVIQTLSDDNHTKVFKTTSWNKSLTNLQVVISDVSRMLGGESYPDPVSFKDLKSLLDDRRAEAAATKIQSFFRGFKAKKVFQEKRSAAQLALAPEPEAARTAAATRIQSLFRGNKTRKGLLGVKKAEALRPR